jgi:hypothetical protein
MIFHCRFGKNELKIESRVLPNSEPIRMQTRNVVRHIKCFLELAASRLTQLCLRLFYPDSDISRVVIVCHTLDNVQHYRFPTQASVIKSSSFTACSRAQLIYENLTLVCA